MEKLRAFLLIFAVMGAATPALADTDGGKSAVVAVIQQQLSALAAGDGTRAFSYAAPAIRQSLGTPDRFMQMVTSGYAALIAPLAVDFQQFEWDGALAVQSVDVIAGDGSAWAVLYYMRQLDNGDWRIAGVEMKRRPGGTV